MLLVLVRFSKDQRSDGTQSISTSIAAGAGPLKTQNTDHDGGWDTGFW